MIEVKQSEIVFGSTYRLIGELRNGQTVAECQFGLSNPNKHEITRPIVAIENNTIYCECGRRFVADKTKVYHSRSAYE